MAGEKHSADACCNVYYVCSRITVY